MLEQERAHVVPHEVLAANDSEYENLRVRQKRGTVFCAPLFLTEQVVEQSNLESTHARNDG